MLRKLTDQEFDKAESLLVRSGYKKDHCPTCDGYLEMGEWISKTYTFQGEKHDCNCAEQYKLFLHYGLAGIPEEYMRLDWARDFRGDEMVSEYIEMYMAGWQSAKRSGMGLEFGGKSLAVGKSFAATTVAKRLMKLGETVYFMRFSTLRNAVIGKDSEVMDKALNDKILVLDEVQTPFAPNESILASFAAMFEDIIRERSAWNRVTIITTNLAEEEIQDAYPRVYSLLAAKQLRIEMTGQDARQTHLSQENLAMLAAGEVRPIS